MAINCECLCAHAHRRADAEELFRLPPRRVDEDHPELTGDDDESRALVAADARDE